jgi:hypothetical protein
MGRIFLLPTFLILFLAAPAWSASPNSALSVLRNLPAAYRAGVVWVSADNADPNPDEWYISARNADRAGLLFNLTISRGRITSERPTISPRALLRQITPINVDGLRVNSTDLWNTAQKFADDQGRRLGSMSLRLEKHGRNSTPVWSVWYYDRRGGYIGYFSALATTGAVTSKH